METNINNKMENLILDTNCGNDFTTVSKKAKAMATAKQNVQFEFNGVICIVSTNTNLDWLYRDYSNSWRMEWKKVGADCVENYSADVQAELERRNILAEEKAKNERIEYRAKEKREKDAFDEKVKGMELELKDAEGWKKSREANTDPYGKAAIDYAEGWAKLMQVEMKKGKTLIECAEKTSFELGFLSITGFMYGCAVSTLSQCWKYGEDLRKWHNKEYKHEGEGVVNPAILTIG